MFRAMFMLFLVVVVGLFGYYYLTNSSQQPSADKAKQAARQVGETLVDQGVAAMVQLRLTTRFGMDRMRFLHVYHEEGTVVIYGLLPEGVQPSDLEETARSIPAVRNVTVVVQPMPENLKHLQTTS